MHRWSKLFLIGALLTGASFGLAGSAPGVPVDLAAAGLWTACSVGLNARPLAHDACAGCGRTRGMGSVILLTQGFGSRSLGAQPPASEWRATISEERDRLAAGTWWTNVFAGPAVIVLVMGVNLLGGGLRDELDREDR